jgi:alkyl sulfatase BDS1-like metallo-beta-lactamase superfamily hydrolase
MIKTPWASFVVMCFVAGAFGAVAHAQETAGPREATETTRTLNTGVSRDLPFADREDFELARRGLIAPAPATVAGRRPGGPLAWNLAAYSFIAPDAPAPDTVNPSLWRQAQLHMNSGLFKVTDRVYQVRGLDIANVTFIEGDTGWIVVDPLGSIEVAKAALDLVHQHLADKPVVAVIYTHPHVDHYGGARGVVSEDDVKAGRVRVVAPKDFMEHAVRENVFAGTAMARRSVYMFGPLLPKGPRGHVDAGNGKAVSLGVAGLLTPTESIDHTGQTLTLDGVQFVFQYTPDTEAPSEMNFYLPRWKALCMAENVAHTMHNLYTPRGAQVRDARAWAHHLDEAITLFGDKTDVMFMSHQWPIWGRDRAIEVLEGQRDLYKYLHDQTLRLANHGYTGAEIAEMLTLPDGLARRWYNRGQYGTVSHNVKAIYQRYLGWFDGNPAHLNPLPPVPASERYVEFMGGAQTVLDKARRAYERGEYRWVAEVVNHVVEAEPNNQPARQLQADALEQLGYQAESPAWRNFYLTGALELRRGVPKLPPRPFASADVVAGMTSEMIFDAFAVRLNGPRAAGKVLRLNYVLSDTNEQFLVAVEHGVLNYWAAKQSPKADATITLTRPVLNQIIAGAATFEQKAAAGEVRVDGDRGALSDFMALMDDFAFWFDIVTPRPSACCPPR